MWPYWLFFLLSSFAAINSGPRNSRDADGTVPVKIDVVWVFVILVLTMMMGFRYKVGGDWLAYIRILEDARSLTVNQVLLHGDPGYWMINLLVAQSEGSIVWVNLCAGLLFAVGTVIFCRSLPRPWLALAVAFPYVILVVGMGYARQGIAMSMVMIGLVALARGRFFWFVFWVFVAASFHKTAIVLVALGGGAVNRNRFLWLPIIAIATLGGYSLFLADYTDQIIDGYITAEYQSSGALIRISMNLVPAALFLIYRRRFVASEAQLKFWALISMLSVAVFVALFAGIPSTALDRMALYLLPLQLFVFSHLPDAIGARGRRNTAIVGLILLYYALVLFVWLNFADNARSWVPYRLWLGD